MPRFATAVVVMSLFVAGRAEAQDVEIYTRGQMTCVQHVQSANVVVTASAAQLVLVNSATGLGSLSIEVYDKYSKLAGHVPGHGGGLLNYVSLTRWTADNVNIAADFSQMAVMGAPDGRFASGYFVLTARGTWDPYTPFVSLTPDGSYGVTTFATCSGTGVAEVTIPFAIQ
jgi:hypothetical protein